MYYFSNSAYYDRCYHGLSVRLYCMYVCMYVCVSVTIIFPANEMPFGRDTCVIPRNCLRRAPPMGRGDMKDWNHQFAAMLPIAKLLWHLLFIFPPVLWCCWLGDIWPVISNTTSIRPSTKGFSDLNQYINLVCR